MGPRRFTLANVSPSAPKWVKFNHFLCFPRVYLTAQNYVKPEEYATCNGSGTSCQKTNTVTTIVCFIVLKLSNWGNLRPLLLRRGAVHGYIQGVSSLAKTVIQTHMFLCTPSTPCPPDTRVPVYTQHPMSTRHTCPCVHPAPHVHQTHVSLCTPSTPCPPDTRVPMYTQHPMYTKHTCPYVHPAPHVHQTHVSLCTPSTPCPPDIRVPVYTQHPCPPDTRVPVYAQHPMSTRHTCPYVHPAPHIYQTHVSLCTPSTPCPPDTRVPMYTQHPISTRHTCPCVHPAPHSHQTIGPPFPHPSLPLNTICVEGEGWVWKGGAIKLTLVAVHGAAPSKHERLTQRWSNAGGGCPTLAQCSVSCFFRIVSCLSHYLVPWGSRSLSAAVLFTSLPSNSINTCICYLTDLYRINRKENCDDRLWSPNTIRACGIFIWYITLICFLKWDNFYSLLGWD